MLIAIDEVHETFNHQCERTVSHLRLDVPTASLTRIHGDDGVPGAGPARPDFNPQHRRRAIGVVIDHVAVLSPVGATADSSRPSELWVLPVPSDDHDRGGWDISCRVPVSGAGRWFEREPACALGAHRKYFARRDRMTAQVRILTSM